MTPYEAELQFLDGVSSGERPLISRETAFDARTAWESISRVFGGRMPVPQAWTGAGGRLLYSWDAGEHHLELEFGPDDPPEFFYENRTTREIREATYRFDDHLPVQIADRFAPFVQAREST